MSLYECADKDFFFSLEPKRPQGYTKEEFDKILVSKLNELDNLHKEGKSGYVGYSDVFHLTCIDIGFEVAPKEYYTVKNDSELIDFYGHSSKWMLDTDYKLTLYFCLHPNGTAEDAVKFAKQSKEKFAF